jgi:hypothetical protein
VSLDTTTRPSASADARIAASLAEPRPISNTCRTSWPASVGSCYRGRGRAERNICDTKATGLTNLPSHSFAINHAWLQLCLCAHDLLAYTRLLTIDNNDDLAHAEPKRLRYCLFHTAAQIVTTSRQRRLRLADDWPWTRQLIAAFDRLRALPIQI